MKGALRMNENINENRNDEILTSEELEAMNKKLQNVENITLPESLAPEKIVEKLENIPQNITEFSEVHPEKKTGKRRKRKTKGYGEWITLLYFH